MTSAATGALPTAATTVASGASLLAAPLASLTGALTIATALVLGVGLGRLSAPPASPAVSVTPAAPSATPATATSPPSPNEPPAASVPLPPSPSASTSGEPHPKADPTPRAAVRSELAAEQALLDRARVALSRGLYPDALSAVRQHAAQFPAGALSAERAGLEVLALSGSGAKQEAEAAARRYIVRYPDGVMIDAVRAVLEPR